MKRADLIVTSTERGFELVNFIDAYDNECSLKQSSLAEHEPPGSSAIWLGKGEECMHLDLELVEQLLPFLQNWIEKGSFKYNNSK